LESLILIGHGHFLLQTCGSSGRSYSYGETRALCRRFANALLGAVGLRPGDVAGLLLPNIPEYAIAIHGAIEAGVVVTFANPLYTPGNSVDTELMRQSATAVYMSHLPLLNSVLTIYTTCFNYQ
jgi:acyl-CoA synthetase (AMP-forming)/AMP-acid ligase II